MQRSIRRGVPQFWFGLTFFLEGLTSVGNQHEVVENGIDYSSR